jgi:hypothetical protein
MNLRVKNAVDHVCALLSLKNENPEKYEVRSRRAMVAPAAACR